MATAPRRRCPPDSSCREAAILDALTEGVFTVDDGFRVTAINAAAAAITGVDRRQVLGRPCRAVFRADCCDSACALAETLRTGRPIQGRRATILDADGERRPVSISTNLLRDAEGRVLGGVETFRDLAQIETLRRELHRTWRLEDLIGRSPAMQRVFALLPAVAASPSTVLITGESGTGKELAARAVHQLSPRAAGPFVAVNCGALPDSLLEAELFGVRKGAFTDATDRPGRFARAAGGSLFLDEIGEVSPAMQVRLLRVLQEKIYEPLGASTAEPADVRLIAATNRDLAALVAEGKFRQDLYYRLDVVRLPLPPLRERPEDIPLLAEHFVDRLNAVQGRAVSGLTDAALAVLARQALPGNVRELQNLIERAFILCGDGPIDTPHLVAPGGLAPVTEPGPAADPLAEAEAGAIREALRRAGGNRQAAARALGIHKTTLFRKLRRLGFQAPRAP